MFFSFSTYLLSCSSCFPCLEYLEAILAPPTLVVLRERQAMVTAMAAMAGTAMIGATVPTTKAAVVAVATAVMATIV